MAVSLLLLSLPPVDSTGSADVLPPSAPSAFAVGTSVNIIVSDNNIAKIRCFITFTSYISFYLIRFRGFKQKIDAFKTWFYPCLKAPLLYILWTA